MRYAVASTHNGVLIGWNHGRIDARRMKQTVSSKRQGDNDE